MRGVIERLFRCQRAATAVEYGLIAGLIFLLLVASVRIFAAKTGSMWDNVAREVTTPR